MSGDVEKWIEAGTQAIKEKNGDDATATEIHLGYISHDYLSDFVLAACRAFLAAAEADGVVLVPRNPTAEMMEAAWRFANHDLQDGKESQMQNLLCAAMNAGKVTV